MKRFLTTILLFLFLLNVLGYYGIFLGWKWKNSKEINARLDEDQYSAKETRTFKIPLTVPYGTNQQDYERVEGEFEFNGEVFRLVKQRLHSDTLYIVCVKDVKSLEIKQALTDYVKTFSDTNSSSKPLSSKGEVSFVKDFLLSSISVVSTGSGWETTAYNSSVATASPLAGMDQLSTPPPQNI